VRGWGVIVDRVDKLARRDEKKIPGGYSISKEKHERKIVYQHESQGAPRSRCKAIGLHISRASHVA
jgi:hypothetical protein